ncbi:phosphatase PAP2 family protein [Ferrimicrobium acidiphilum]|uniref:phosphatase PAP2 family protein n=2 Tax=Ferrimicrobium acidiphilum TaxID=121039 RepID=UPI0027D28FF5|nr:phosphatase PAP2 family protein [Ferrimicrobium acidiphilum]
MPIVHIVGSHTYAPNQKDATGLRQLDRFDTAVDHAFAPLRGRIMYDRLFYILSALADHSLLWELMAATLAISPRRRPLAMRAAAALAAESVVINVIVKSLFSRERPIDQSYEHPHHLRYPLTSSFPSGHATAAFAAATLLSDRTWLRWLLYPLATLVALSRIHVRIHHASDVLGGAIIGLCFAKLIKYLLPVSSSPSTDGAS